jgi:hypothetical protein
MPDPYFDKALVLGVMPPAVRSNDRISRFRTPRVSLVRVDPVVTFEHWIDRSPSGFHSVFSREECAVAGHGVSQEPFVRSFFTGHFF